MPPGCYDLRVMRLPNPLPGLLLLVTLATPAVSGTTLYKEARFDMGVMPDQAASSWSQVGSGASFLLPDNTLVVNDNSTSDRIGYQTLLGDVAAEHRVSLSARVKVLSSLGGDAVTLEIARPGLELVLQLHPASLVLLERRGTGNYRFLGSVPVDLSEFREIGMRKDSITEQTDERVVVTVDGTPVLEAAPRGDGRLGVGRLLIGSTSYADLGASFWDWVSYRLETVDAGVATTTTSFGRLKSRF